MEADHLPAPAGSEGPHRTHAEGVCRCLDVNPSDLPARNPYKARAMRLPARRLGRNVQNLGQRTTAYRSAKVETLILFAPLGPVVERRSAHNGATYAMT